MHLIRERFKKKKTPNVGRGNWGLWLCSTNILAWTSSTHYDLDQLFCLLGSKLRGCVPSWPSDDLYKLLCLFGSKLRRLCAIPTEQWLGRGPLPIRLESRGLCVVLVERWLRWVPLPTWLEVWELCAIPTKWWLRWSPSPLRLGALRAVPPQPSYHKLPKGQ